MNPSNRLSPKLRRLILLPTCLLCLAHPAWAQSAPAPTATEANPKKAADEAAVKPADSEVIALSPFEVVSDTKGYYSANTMSGTRMNSKIEDLASAITVVTKEQMSDFAMLDINDIFLYTAGTEGTGTYTAFTVDRNGSVSDNVQLDPSNANRVRGVAPANVSLGNIETMKRTPVDPLSIDGVEISRGPNANVFGLGNPSGTVNMVLAAGNLSRNRTETQFRVDSYGGTRTSLDANRVLVKNVLAVRVSAAYQHDSFARKPAGVDTERYNGMVKYRPFKDTTISAAYQYYHSYGQRPNFSPPRDNVSYWLASGKPTWDPVAQVVHVNGQTLGPFTSATGLPDYFTATFTGSTHNFAYVDQNGLGLWTAPVTTLATSPLNATLGTATSGTVRYLATTPASGSALGKITAQPLFATTPSVGSKAIYDWNSIDLASVNWTMDRNITSNVAVDQVFLSTERNTIVGNVAFMREDSQRYQRLPMGPANDNGQSGQLYVDINEKLLDGTPNPYFLRPYIGTDQPRTTWTPYKWDTYRAQAAYKLDLSHEAGWLKWLGVHQLTAYDEYKYRIQRNFSFRDVITSNNPWIPAGTIRGNQSGVTNGPGAAPNLTRSYFRYYVGGPSGTGHVDYAPHDFSYGNYPFVWGGAGGVFNHEQSTLGQVAVTDAAGGGSNSKTILKTAGAVLQSHFLNDQVVTTFGTREDKVYTLFGATPQINADGQTYNYDAMNAWAPGDYRFNSGLTHSAQLVARPFRGLGVVKRMAESPGLAGFIGGALSGLQFTGNWSDSFLPQAPAQDLFQNLLPNTTGTDRELGVGINLFDGRLVIRMNHYETRQLAARNGDANTVATRAARIDIGTTDAFNFVKTAQTWVTADPNFAGNPTAIAAQVAKVTGLDTAEQQFLTSPTPGLAATNDITAKGTEIEINYNPTKFWTISASATEGRSVNSNVSSVIQQWINQRMPFWLSAVDTRTNTLWWNTTYSGNVQSASGTSPSANFASFVQAPYSIIQQTQGKSNAQYARYNFRVSTNYQLAGITENSILKHVNTGAAFRWQDKSAIGYYGLQQLPAIITQLDPNRPIFTPPQAHVDLFVGYRTRLFNNRIPATFQFNVRDVFENGNRLQAVGVYPDGTPDAYRIVDPRTYIMTLRFEL